MVTKGQGKRIGWGRWQVAEVLGVVEEWGKYGSLNVIFDGNRFLKYRKGSITQFRNQGIVFQFACKNRKKYGCRAVIERIEFTTNQPKMYRISNNIHCEECQKRLLNKNNRNHGTAKHNRSNEFSQFIPKEGMVCHSNARSNVNLPPPPSVVHNSSERNFRHKRVTPPKQKRIDHVTTKEMRRRMFHLRKEYNMLYSEYQKRKSQVNARKEWYEIPVPPATNSKNNVPSYFSSPSRDDRDVYQPSRGPRRGGGGVKYEIEDSANVDFCESAQSSNNILPKIDSLLYPELRGNVPTIERPEGDWEYYSGFEKKRYLLN